MTDLVLLFFCQLRRGLTEFRYVKNRIVTESVGPLLFISDPPFNGSSCGKFSAVREHCCNGTDESGSTLFLRHSFQSLDQICIFYGIRRILSQISGRIDSRFLIQGIDLQSGVIRNHDIFRKSSHRTGLDQCILFVGLTVFFNICFNARIFHGYDFQTGILHDHADFFDFSGIAGREYDSSLHINSLPHLCSYIVIIAY